MFYSNDKEVGMIESAHDGIIWGLAWHPLGHILCSGSNDHASKFWTRNRPGDKMRDRYNLNTIPAGVLIDDSLDIGKSRQFSLLLIINQFNFFAYLYYTISKDSPLRGMSGMERTHIGKKT